MTRGGRLHVGLVRTGYNQAPRSSRDFGALGLANRLAEVIDGGGYCDQIIINTATEVLRVLSFSPFPLCVVSIVLRERTGNDSVSRTGQRIRPVTAVGNGCRRGQLVDEVTGLHPRTRRPREREFGVAEVRSQRGM